VVVETGTDEDGDPITAVNIDWQQGLSPRMDGRWTPSMRLLRRILMTLLVDHGRTVRPFADGPEVRACDLDLVRAEFYRQLAADGSPDQKQDTRRKAFTRAVRSAQEANLIATRDMGGVQLVWLVAAES
jgi:hypothetical protein